MPLTPVDYRKTAYIHRIGIAADRPAAADVLPGTLYFATDTFVLSRSTGAAWATLSLVPALHASTHEVGGSDEIPAVAWEDQANTFTEGQTINVSSEAGLILDGAANWVKMFDNAQASGSRLWDFGLGSTLFNFWAMSDDDGTILSTPLILDRSGNIFVEDAIFELGRSVALGYWQAVAYNGADYTANAGATWTVASGDVVSNRYTIIGKTIIWSVQIAISSITVATPTVLTIAAPAGVSLSIGISPTAYINDGAAVMSGIVQVASASSINIQKLDGSAFPLATNTLYLYFTLVAELA